MQRDLYIPLGHVLTVRDGRKTQDQQIKTFKTTYR